MYRRSRREKCGLCSRGPRVGQAADRVSLDVRRVANVAGQLVEAGRGVVNEELTFGSLN